MGVAMAKAGRKRKSGYRTASGALARPKVDFRAMAAGQPHRSWLPVDKQLDQKADSPLGALNLIGVLTDDQYLAGQRFSVIVGEYRAQLGGPTAVAGSGRGYDCNPLGCADEGGMCECLRRKNRYEGCYEILHEAGRKVLMVVNRVVLHGQRCMSGELESLRCGLNVLGRHLGLTGTRKSVHAGNRNS
jgi:hypothetical protein